MVAELSLYDFKEKIAEGIDPDMTNWVTLMEERYVYHAYVGGNGMPNDVTEKLKKQGYNEGDTILLIFDI